MGGAWLLPGCELFRPSTNLMFELQRTEQDLTADAAASPQRAH